MRHEVVFSEGNGTEKIDVTKGDLMPNLYTPLDLAQQIYALYNDGLKQGSKTGWLELDKFYSVSPGQWTLVTGIPGHGKSEFIDALMVNLSKEDWRFLVYSPENHPLQVHAAKLVEKIAKMPFWPGPTDRIPQQELVNYLGELGDKFTFLKPMEEQPNDIQAILDQCIPWIIENRSSSKGIVIDPWNEVEHQRPQKWSETEYISDTLSKLRRFARNMNVHIWIVAHPAKLNKDKDGNRPIPTPYDVSGSAHWYNKADNCITVWRNTSEETQLVQIHVQKIRFKHTGKIGVVELRYDRVTGNYYDRELRSVNSNRPY